MKLSKDWHKDLSYLLILEGIILFLFRDTLLLKGVFFSGDIRAVMLPFRLYTALQISHGIFPLWSPYILLGYPYAFDFIAGVFYPITYLFFLPFPPHAAINYYVIFHYLVAGWGTYYYGRSIGLQRISAFISGLSFAMGGFMLSRLCHVTIFDIIAFLPVVLWILEKGFQKDKWLYAGYAGLVTAIMFLGGHTQFAVYMMMMGGFYLLAGPLFYKDKNLLFWLKSLGFYCFIAIGTSAVMALPMKQMIAYSYRAGGIPWENLTNHSIPLSHLLRFFFPFLFGYPYEYHYSDLNFVETCGYIGILPLLLIFIQLFGNQKTSYQKFYLWIFFISLVIALGKYTPLIHILKYTPILRLTQGPGRMLVFTGLAGAILGGLGMDYMISNRMSPSRRRYSLIFLSIAAIFGTGFFLYALLTKNPFYSLRIPRGYDLLMRAAFIVIISGLLAIWIKKSFKYEYVPLILAGFLAIDLLTFGLILNRDANKSYPLSSLYQHPATVDFIKKDTSSFRIYSFSNHVWDDPGDEYKQFKTLHRNMPMYFGLEGFHTYCCGGVWRLYELMDKLEQNWNQFSLEERNNQLADRLSFFRQANIKYILSLEPITVPGIKEVFQYQDAKVYEVEKVKPRIYFAEYWSTVTSPKEALSRLTSHPAMSVDTSIVEITNPKTLPASYSLDSMASFSVIKQKAGKFILKTQTASTSLLVFADYYFPGWKATIDGKPSDILRTNYMMKGIVIPPGSHDVRMWFFPLYFYVGLTITLITLFILFLLTLSSIIKSKIKT
jgi:uncharacterized membrane protein YfhO